MTDADRIAELTAELETARRLIRVDEALARQLARSIARNSRLYDEIERWLQAYPFDVFPKPDMAKAAALLDAGGMTLDAISAANMRHVLHRLLGIMRDE